MRTALALLRNSKWVGIGAGNLFVLLVCFALSDICLVAARSKSTSASEDRPPNFIVFFVDDLGYGDLGFTGKRCSLVVVYQRTKTRTIFACIGILNFFSSLCFLGHPTTKTPNLDKLAWNGKILTTWYSGCNVCTGSRASLMTGRQFPRTGLPGVIPQNCPYGLNLKEITLAEQLKKGGYATGIVGKWHLGQRKVYLPGSRGFDYYLGIPFSDDMGVARESSCPAQENEELFVSEKGMTPLEDIGENQQDEWPNRMMYEQLGLMDAKVTDAATNVPDKGSKWLPLVHQEFNKTQILEQPVDFTTLAEKYSNFATTFLEKHQESPFFLFVPFSHVHVTAWGSTKENQYAGCDFQKSTERGTFGDALAETDWIAGTIVQKLKDLGLEENTLILFTSDNGPWMSMKLSGGSAGLFTGRFAEGYTNTAKGTNWVRKMSCAVMLGCRFVFLIYSCVMILLED